MLRCNLVERTYHVPHWQARSRTRAPEHVAVTAPNRISEQRNRSLTLARFLELDKLCDLMLTTWPTALNAAGGTVFLLRFSQWTGGLKSRLARHIRKGKSLHWHVDQLTECGAMIGAPGSSAMDENATWLRCLLSN